MPEFTGGEVDVLNLIEAKKAGAPHSAVELAALVNDYASGQVPDYQMAAWLMAVRLRGLTSEEARAFALVMADSGRSFTWDGLAGPVVDKHSTGGVGDKTSLVVVPLAAACGLAVPKISGRGLGSTGGTLDKLESIPGLNVRLDVVAFERQVRRIGCAIVAQTDDMVPADGAIYALRDVTGTVDSIHLIAASIMAKKLAAGAQTILVDVKCGSGAFMRDFDSAMQLAELLVEIAAAAGRKLRAIVTGMDQPLGWSIGHSLEVEETLAALSGRGPADLVELSLTIVAALVRDSGLRPAPRAARQRAENALSSGEAEAKFRELVAAQGGSIEDFERQPPHAALPVKMAMVSPATGYLARLDAAAAARALRILGGARNRKGGAIDLAVGLRFAKKVGDPVQASEEIGWILAREPAAAELALAAMCAGVAVTETPPPPPHFILGQVAR